MGTVTRWIQQVKRGDDAAATKLWNRYFEDLVRHARWKLRGCRRRLADEEDVASKALEEFFRAARRGRYPNLSGRASLWRLLLRITACRAADLQRQIWRETQKLKGESAIHNRRAERGRKVLDEVLGNAPSPEVVAASTEKCRKLLELLGDSSLREIVVAKLEGYKNEEIARRLRCGLSTVERKLKLIRAIWKNHGD